MSLQTLSWLVILTVCFASFTTPRSAHSQDPQTAPTTSLTSATKPTDRFVDVGGIRLSYVDWGGHGPVVLFLAGFGNDAHVFDTFAPLFIGDFHAIGLTRRGFGSSDKPQDGYDVATRTRDIAGFLDAIGIDHVNFVGHSMAGDEMTLFASLYPDRVDRLVYLDAAYDHAKALDLMLMDPGTPPLFERMILDARHSARASSVQVPDMPPPAQWNVLVKTLSGISGYHIEYSHVKAPSLALYANPGHYDGIEPATPEAERRRMERWWTERQRPSDVANIAKFRREAQRGEVVEVQGASHYLFLGTTQTKVAEKTIAFLSQGAHRPIY